MFYFFEGEIDVFGVDVVFKYLCDIFYEVIDVSATCFTTSVIFDVIEEQPCGIETRRVGGHGK
jgi:hypothetical protein